MKRIFPLTCVVFTILSLVVLIDAQTRKVGAAKGATAQRGILSIEAGVVFRNGDVKPLARTHFVLVEADLETVLKESGVEPYMTASPNRSSSTTNQPNSASGQTGSKSSIAAGILGQRIERDTPLSFVESYATWNKYSDTYAAELTQYNQAVKAHAVAEATTDFTGKAEFPSVKTGRYYLVGVSQINRQGIVWNLPVDVKAGRNSVVLDNNNAAKIR